MSKRQRAHAKRQQARKVSSSPSSWIRITGLALLCLKLALVPVVFDPASLFVFAVPKALLSLALAVGLAGTLAALLLADGPRILAWGSPQWAVLATVIAYTIAAAFAQDHVVALFGAPGRLLGLASVLDGATLYAALLVLVRTRAHVAMLLAATITGATLVLAYALVQRLDLDPLPWASGFGPLRPFSTLGNPGVLAQYLGPLAVAFLALAAFSAGLSRLERAGLVVAGSACVLGVLASATRASFIGFALAAFALALVALHRSRLRGRTAVFAGVTALVVVTIGAGLFTPIGRLAATAASDALSEREALAMVTLSTEPPAQQVENSLLSRIVLYEIAAQQFRDHPLLGVGPDNFVAAYPRYRPEGIFGILPTTAPETSTHSWLAKLLTDAGLAGAVAFFAALSLSVWVAIRSRFAGMSVGGLAALAFYLGAGLVSINDIGTEWIPWVSLAMLVSPVSLPSAQPHRSRHRTPLATLVLGTGIVAALWSGFAFAGSRAAAESRNARARADASAAVRSAERSVDLDGLRAEHWHGLGLSYAAAGRYRDALRAFERTVELAPYHATYLANVAKAHLVLAGQNVPGAAQRAVAAAEQGVATDPNNGEAVFTLALVAEQSGQHARAAELSERGLQLLPRAREAGSYEIAGRAYLALRQYADAERWLRLGLPVARPSETVPIRTVLARVLAATGRITEALDQLDLALAVEPTNVAALRLRAELAPGR